MIGGLWKPSLDRAVSRIHGASGLGITYSPAGTSEDITEMGETDTQARYPCDH